jgi:hypothetical protein
MVMIRKDRVSTGLILGLIGPVLGLLVIYLLRFRLFQFSEFLDEFLHNNRMLTGIGSLSLLANVILFTIFVNTRRDQTAKGIFVVTLVYGIGILVLKVFN